MTLEVLIYLYITVKNIPDIFLGVLDAASIKYQTQIQLNMLSPRDSYSTHPC